MTESDYSVLGEDPQADGFGFEDGLSASEYLQQHGLDPVRDFLKVAHLPQQESPSAGGPPPIE